MDLRDLSTSNYLKVVFLVHFILGAWGIQGYWSPDSYLFYNSILLILIMWSLHAKENAEPIQLAIVVNVCSILLDIIVLGVYFPSSTTGGSERFSAAMAIINLVVRPVSTIIMSRNCSQRLGLDSDNFSNIIGAGGSRSNYDDIDGRSPS